MRRTPGGRGRIADVSDTAGTLDGRDAHTVVRRVTTSDGPGPLVRVTTVAAGRGAPGLVLLAVAAPGPRQAADGAAADRVVRSLSAAVPAGTAPAGRRSGRRPARDGGRARAPARVARSARRQPAGAHRSLTATPSSASRWRVSGRLIPTTLAGSPWMPSTNQPPSPSRVNAPATVRGSPEAR